MRFFGLGLAITLLLLACKSPGVFLNSNTVSVKDFGARGDGRQDDTRAIQAAVDYCLQNEAKQIFFPGGTYLVSSVNVGPGLRLYSNGDATLLKMAGSPKFSRIFTTQYYCPDSDTDLPLTHFDALNFDGNRLEQGAYLKHQLEHQAMLFIMGKRTNAGRFRARVSNCHFKEGVADAISIYCNADVEVENCTAENVFRGGVTITGGNTKVRVNNLKTWGDVHPTGIDVEIDGAGFEGSMRVDVAMKNLQLTGDFDVGMVGDQSIFVGENIATTKPPFNLYALDSKVVIRNSSFVTDDLRRANVYFPNDVTFEDCSFMLNPLSSGQTKSCINVYWSTSSATRTNQKLKLIDCTFKLLESVEGTAYAIFNNACDHARENMLEIENCSFEGGFSTAVYFRQGGQVQIDGMHSDSQVDLRLGSVVNKSNYRYRAKINRLKRPDQAIPVIDYRDHEENFIEIDARSARGLRSSQKSRGAGTNIRIIE